MDSGLNTPLRSIPQYIYFIFIVRLSQQRPVTFPYKYHLNLCLLSSLKQTEMKRLNESSALELEEIRDTMRRLRERKTECHGDEEGGAGTAPGVLDNVCYVCAVYVTRRNLSCSNGNNEITTDICPLQWNLHISSILQQREHLDIDINFQMHQHVQHRASWTLLYSQPPQPFAAVGVWTSSRDERIGSEFN